MRYTSVQTRPGRGDGIRAQGRPRWVIVVAVASLFVGACNSRGSADDAKTANRPPNILFLQWDTVRADRVGCYGYTKPTTPHLDEFAREARVYERAITPGGWTIPAVCSIFTGYYPTRHGAGGFYTWLRDEYVTLAEHLKAAGYQTYYFSANPFLSKAYNTTQGFDVVEHPWDDPWKAQVEALYQRKGLFDDPGTEVYRVIRNERQATRYHLIACGEVANDALLGWLAKRDRSRPFFAKICYMEAHMPRIPSREMRKRVMSPESMALCETHDLSQERQTPYLFGLEEFTPQELEAISGIYDATIAQLDEVTHTLIEALRTQGLLDNTVIVIYADHGDNLGEHHMMDHQYSLYRTITDVPLVIRYPAKFQPGRDATPVNLIDLFPTVMELAGCADQIPADQQGHSLLRPRDPATAVQISEYNDPLVALLWVARQKYPQLDWRPWLRRLRLIGDGDYRYIWASDGEHELYNVRDDPGETHNLLIERRDVTRQMQERLSAWAASFPHYRPQRPAARDATGVSDEQRQMLIDLGYLPPDATDNVQWSTRPSAPTGTNTSTGPSTSPKPAGSP